MKTGNVATSEWLLVCYTRLYGEVDFFHFFSGRGSTYENFTSNIIFGQFNELSNDEHAIEFLWVTGLEIEKN